MQIVLYDKIVRIGGVYTFDLNFAKHFHKEHDLLYVYEAGDPPQIEGIRKYATIIKNTGQPIECDICIYSSLTRGGHKIKAKKYIQMLHADLAFWNIKKYKPTDVDLHIAVGQSVADSFKEHNGMDSIVIPNLLAKPELSKVLRLVTASRLSKGKGIGRIVKMAKALRANGVKFIWELYGRGSKISLNDMLYDLTYVPEVIHMGEHSDVQNYMQYADYIVQLSDSEGFCYSIHEALQIGKPVIVTRWQGVEKVVEDGVNGHILEMDLSNLDTDKICNSIPKNVKLDLSENTQQWGEVLKI